MRFDLQIIYVRTTKQQIIVIFHLLYIPEVQWCRFCESMVVELIDLNLMGWEYEGFPGRLGTCSKT